ncbi:MAG: glycine/sarcosine/betaine reductase selenoprotein B family protein [Pseudomonadota bacterium]
MAHKLTNRLLVGLYRVPWVKKRWVRRFQPLESSSIPWTPVTKPLDKCKVALLTTGGVHLRTDSPFNMDDKDGDPSYRKIPSTATPDQLTITHDYYDHRDADRDINLVFPIDILRKCQQEGLLGKSADFFYSFMGHIDGPHLKTLLDRTAKEVAVEMKEGGVEVAILVPA